MSEILDIEEVVNNLFDVLIKLEYIYYECKEDNWDGYGANKLARKILNNAKWLVKNKLNILPEEITVDSDGTITFEYRNDKFGDCFMITIDETEIYYTGCIVKECFSGIHEINKIDIKNVINKFNNIIKKVRE